MEHWKVEVANSTQSQEAQVANVGEKEVVWARYPNFQQYDLASVSQTIYGEGDIQVAKVGAMDVNKIQWFWHIRFNFFPLSYAQAPSFIQLLAKIHTHKKKPLVTWWVDLL